MKDQIEHFKELNDKLKNVTEKKIRLEEQFRNKKQTLTELIKEIKDAGYDPTKLNDIIAEKEDSIKAAIKEFEEELQAVSAQLSEIEEA